MFALLCLSMNFALHVHALDVHVLHVVWPRLFPPGTLNLLSILLKTVKAFLLCFQFSNLAKRHGNY